MSDLDIFEGVEPKKEKKIKKKRVISDERRKQLLENLKKGRETSRINRGKKKTARELKKREKEIEIDDTIKKSLKISNREKELENEIETLKNKIKFFEDNKNEPKKNDSVKADDTIYDYKPKQRKKISFINQELITKKNDNEINGSTFKSSLWD